MILGSAVVVLALAVVGVALLRFVNPPVTAFMAQAWWQTWRGGEALRLEQRWLHESCMPRSLKLAVMAAEDQKFAYHWGFDVAQIADALDEAQRGGRVRGASTLTQQTAKNLFLWPGQSWLRKGLEAGLTGLLEGLWPKRRILEVYLNVAEFGPGIYGVEAAARRYFGKSAGTLAPTESALLAGVLPSPRSLDARNPSPYLRERQRWILKQMPRVAALPGVAELLQVTPGVRCPAPAG